MTPEIHTPEAHQALYTRLTTIASPGLKEMAVLGIIESEAAKFLALALDNCPNNRELEIAIQKWEEALYFIRQSIKRG